MQKNLFVRSIAAVSGIAMLAGLAACGDNNGSTASTSTASTDSNTVKLSGEFAGAGASSQKAAVDAWVAGFKAKQPGANIAYDPSGSGTGVTTFLQGSTIWAGSDKALSNDDVKKSDGSVCAAGTTAFDIPVYISPIAIVYNLKSAGLNGTDKHLNLDADTVAKIFDGKITNWNDPEIAKQNPDAKLPDLAINPVWRSDKSGTTKNFQDYLHEAAPDSWTYDSAETWPNQVGTGAKSTSGIITTVNQTEGSIGYADASQAGELGTVAVKVGEMYVAYSAEGAAKTVDASPKDDKATEANRVVYKIDHATKEDGAYPVVLVSYDIACTAYAKDDNGNKAEFAKQWLTYVVSDEGQQVAAQNAGSAPISSALRTEVMKSIDAIKTK